MRMIEATFIALTTKKVFLYVTPYNLAKICKVWGETADPILKVN